MAVDRTLCHDARRASLLLVGFQLSVAGRRRWLVDGAAQTRGRPRQRWCFHLTASPSVRATYQVLAVDGHGGRTLNRDQGPRHGRIIYPTRDIKPSYITDYQWVMPAVIVFPPSIFIETNSHSGLTRRLSTDFPDSPGCQPRIAQPSPSTYLPSLSSEG